MKNIPSIHIILTKWFPQGIWETEHEAMMMTDSSDPFAELEAKILLEAQRDIEELRRLTSKYNIQLPQDAKEDVKPIEQSEPSHPEAEPANQKSHPEQVEIGEPVKSGYKRHDKSWTETIVDVVRSEQAGLTTKDLKSRIAETHLGERLSQTETAFYGAISKLKARSKLIEHKGRLYTPDTFAQFRRDVEAGLVEDVEAPAPKGQTSPAKGAILSYLAAPDRSATAGEIIKMLLTNKDTKKKTLQDKKPVYNLLNRLTRRGELVNRDGRYSLASKKNEAPIAEASGASSPDEVAASSKDSEKVHRLFR